MSQTRTAQFDISGKTLNVYCVVLQDGNIPVSVLDYAKDAFANLAPYIHNHSQVLYIRDIPFLTIDGEYPGGHCYNPYEAMIALNSWRDDEQLINATIDHELHHMARWQNPGYGETLGGAILSEGIATLYEEVRTGFHAPYADAAISDEIIKAAIKSWDDPNYNHSEWFFKGPSGKWVGYGIGYWLAQQLFKDGFDLQRSITIEPAEAFKYV